MLKKIKRAFGFGSCDPMEGSTIIINAEKLERRVALLENGVLEEYTIEREGEDNIVGGIFKGRVKNIEPGLKAMFVDIGQEKNAFLHFWDALPAALDSSLEEIEREGRPKKQQRKITSKDIPDIYPIGSEIMVQVTKGPIGTKGPRVTTNVSLAGRYLVLMPFTDQFGISRKIEDPKERLRLRQIMQHAETECSGWNGYHHAHGGTGPALPPLCPRPRHAAGTMVQRGRKEGGQSGPRLRVQGTGSD